MSPVEDGMQIEQEDSTELFPGDSASQEESYDDSDDESADDFDDESADDFDNDGYPNDYIPSDPYGNPFNEMENKSPSVIYAASKLSAGNDDWKTFRERLRRADVHSVNSFAWRHKESMKGLENPEPLEPVLEGKLVKELKLLQRRLAEVPSYQKSYLKGQMNPILVEAISEVEAVEIRGHSVEWNLVPNILQSKVFGLSCPMPDGSIAYPTLGRKGDTLITTPDGDQHPLGQQVIEYILRSSEHAKLLPLNHTTLVQTTGVHDVMIFEYTADDSEESREVALNRNINVGLFKAWQDVDLGVALGKEWCDRIETDFPFCLVWRICGTYWAIEYVAARSILLHGELEPTYHSTVAEGDWAKDPVKFLRTAKEAYRICAKRVKDFRGGMMQALYERVQTNGVVLQEKPLEKIDERLYLKKPPTLYQVAITNFAQKNDTASQNAGAETQSVAQEQTAVQAQTAVERQSAVQKWIAVQTQTAVPEQTAAQENSDPADDLLQTLQKVSLDSDSKTVVKGESQ